MSTEEIAALVGLIFGREDVRAEDRLIEDLGAESVDIINLMAAVEDKFGVFIADEEVVRIHTVDDLIRSVKSGLDGQE